MTQDVNLPENPIRVLIVDDEGSICFLLKRVLKEEGFEAYAAESGEKALEVLREKPIDIILTDIMMSGMNGIEFILKAREINPDVSCVMMTGYPNVSSASESMRQGALDYICKPFDLKHLSKTLVEARKRQIQSNLEIEKKIKAKLANMDMLTGLCNSRQFYMTLEEILEEGNKELFPITIVFIDVDRLRNINKIHGIDAGDEILKKIAQVIQEKFPPPSLWCRCGGDEFLLMLPKTSKEEATQEMKTLKPLLSGYSGQGHESISFSISAGYVTYPEDGMVAHLLIQEAQKSKRPLESS